MLFFFSRCEVFPWGRTFCQDVTVNIKSSLNIIQIDLYCNQNHHCSLSLSIKHNNSKYLKIVTQWPLTTERKILREPNHSHRTFLIGWCIIPGHSKGLTLVNLYMDNQQEKMHMVHVQFIFSSLLQKWDVN